MEFSVTQLVGATFSVAAPMGVWIWNLASKVATLTTKVNAIDKNLEEKKGTLNQMAVGHADHDKRLAVIEQVVQDLKQVPPLLHSIHLLTTKMDAVLENATRRLELVEGQVFKLNQ